jgi:tRNA-dihydrouridine synthase 4
VRVSTDTGLIYSLFHRHVAYMLEDTFTSKSGWFCSRFGCLFLAYAGISERIYFNSLASHAGVVDYLQARKHAVV